MILKREDEYNFNKNLPYGVLLKHCSFALQNSIRGTSEYEYFGSLEDVSALWVEVKRLCTVGVITHADPEKMQRNTDFCFSKVHKFKLQIYPYHLWLLSLRGICLGWGRKRIFRCRSFYRMRWNAKIRALNNPRVKATPKRFKVKSDKKQAMNFLIKLDGNRFTSQANDLALGINNYLNNWRLWNWLRHISPKL